MCLEGVHRPFQHNSSFIISRKNFDPYPKRKYLKQLTFCIKNKYAVLLFSIWLLRWIFQPGSGYLVESWLRRPHPHGTRHCLLGGSLCWVSSVCLHVQTASDPEVHQGWCCCNKWRQYLGYQGGLRRIWRMEITLLIHFHQFSYSDFGHHGTTRIQSRITCVE